MSSSLSVMSGSPSPSVSRCEDEILRLKDAENALLLAQMVNAVVLNTSVGVPEIAPEVPSRRIPSGIETLDSQLVIDPPEVIGTRSTTEMFTIRSRLVAEYANAIALSSESSRASQSPSPSKSEGALVAFNGSVPQSNSAVSFQPSSSSSLSNRSATESPSVSTRTVIEMVTELVCAPEAFAQIV